MGEATQDELDPKRASVEAALELEQLDVNLFRSVRLWKPLPSSRAVFGGQIIGQSLAAAARTVKDAALSVHSLHSYFIRPGDNSLAAVYYVRRVRDGHSFAARQVTAQQGGVSIFEALVSFHRAEASTLDYQDKMPLDVPPADSLPTRQENWQKLLDTKRDKMPKAMVDFVEARIRAPFPLDMRNCDPSIEGFTMRTRRRPREPRQRLWIRAAQRLNDEPISHACVAAYASDYHMTAVPRALPRRRMDVVRALQLQGGRQPRPHLRAALQARRNARLLARAGGPCQVCRTVPAALDDAAAAETLRFPLCLSIACSRAVFALR